MLAFTSKSLDGVKQVTIECVTLMTSHLWLQMVTMTSSRLELENPSPEISISVPPESGPDAGLIA